MACLTYKPSAKINTMHARLKITYYISARTIVATQRRTAFVVTTTPLGGERAFKSCTSFFAPVSGCSCSSAATAACTHDSGESWISSVCGVYIHSAA